ncbi:MAG: 16S rRNA (cytosine(1402)-N(4))-methyltransferase RsmH, partial [Planifilum fulgidum]
DCTPGGGGDSRRIADRLGPGGLLIGIDQDPYALEAAQKSLDGAGCRIRLVRSNFRRLAEILDELQIDEADGFLFDLGVSSPQLDQEERGFSYHRDAPLDMRMDPDREFTAYDLVNTWPEEEIARILSQYGEERFARRIAGRIVERRRRVPIRTTRELAEIIKESIPAAARRRGPHPARRSFQAIRIAVNDELGAFSSALDQAIKRLRKGGRICVISFHSLEDRICKRAFQAGERGCVCPSDFPVCVCNQRPFLRSVTKKPILPSPREVEQNPRARSAKLRIAEKI